MNDKKMHLKYDSGCAKQDNYLPLERIQDVDINQNCCERCWGVKSIVISTAGGTPIQVFGLKVSNSWNLIIITLIVYLGY